MEAIFFWPSGPLLDRRSRAGMAMVRSCMIIEELMYGVIPMAMMVMLEKLLPVIMLTRSSRGRLLPLMADLTRT